MKLLLHACCGPCSLEPIRILAAEGHQISIYYANSNIAPTDEYARRLDTLLSWAKEEGIEVIEGSYQPHEWNERVAPWAIEAQGAPELRCKRCRACYALRFEETARYASEHGFEGIGTTLSVSPYQFTSIIAEELQAAAERLGLACVFRDFRPFYDNATERSRTLGMYRQNYCGCGFSAAEAAQEREERKAQRKAEKEAWAAAHAEEIAQAAAALAENRAQKQAYAQKQAKKRAILRSLRQSQEAEANGASDRANTSFSLGSTQNETADSKRKEAQEHVE